MALVRGGNERIPDFQLSFTSKEREIGLKDRIYIIDATLSARNIQFFLNSVKTNDITLPTQKKTRSAKACF
jgi:hypothetical protein